MNNLGTIFEINFFIVQMFSLFLLSNLEIT